MSDVPADPITKPKEDFETIILKIRSDTSVGIDAQLTHAIIIEYLQQLTKRMERIEKILNSKN